MPMRLPLSAGLLSYERIVGRRVRDLLKQARYNCLVSGGEALVITF